MRIFILGLRRSGTTIFWEMFRQDPELLALNEPFNPVMADLPIELPNRSRREFIRLFRQDPARFWSLFAPISAVEELHESLSDRQRAYFRFLLDQSPGIVLDATRVHFKLRDLVELAPDAVVVHLYRGPASFASSHLVPTGSGGSRGSRLHRAYGRLTFWNRDSRFNYWGIEEIVTRSPESLFAHRCREIGLDPPRVYALPAVGRVLAYWRVAYERLESTGPRRLGDRPCLSPRRAPAKSATGLPLSVQLIGNALQEKPLLQAAHWLHQTQGLSR